MRHAPVVLIALAISVPALAQECLWSSLSTPIPQGSRVYDSVNGRVLSISFNGAISAWNGTAWTAVPTVGVLSHLGPVTFDSVRGCVVAHGGGSGLSLYNDTREWDGLTWRLVSELGPSGTDMITFDEARNRTVLFHRVTGTGPGQTWTWDGSTWSMATWSGPPTGFYSIVYDSFRQRVVMFGISSPSASRWEWNGAAWMQLPNAPLVIGTAMYDSGRRRIVAHGGSTSVPNTAATQTWELDPQVEMWEQRSVGGPLPGGLVFDAARGTGQMLSYSNFTGYTSWKWNGNGSITPIVISAHPSNLQVMPGQEAVFTVSAQTNGALTYQWFKGTTPLTNSGTISGATSASLHINPASLADAGYYSVAIGNGCATVQSNSANLFVIGGFCYPNCDGSTAPPLLTANDFFCFFMNFVGGNTYANCDGVGGLTGEDFQCFLDKYVAGCY